MTKRYSEQFKQESLNFVQTHPSLGIATIAKQLGVAYSTLDSWLRQYRQSIGGELASALNALRLRFDKARDKAIKQIPAIAKDVKHFQFRDLRAKAASDKAESETMRDAQLQLGHSSMAMTEKYVRLHRWQKVTPTK